MTPPALSATDVTRRRADRLAFVLAAAIALSTWLPFACLDAVAPTGSISSGLDTNLPDQASYLMWIEQHRAGAFLARNRMTTEPVAPIAPNPTWLLLGGLSRVTGLEPITAYHVGRVVLAFLYLLALWRLALEVLTTPRAALLAFGCVAVGGGFGWLCDLGLPLRSSDWMTEMWSYPSLLHYPHFALALLLVAEGLRRLLRARRTGRARDGWLAGALLAALVFVHPYTAATLAVALAVEAALAAASTRWRDPNDPAVLPATLRALGPLAAALAAFALHALTNPSLRQWSTQNVMTSPPALEYVLGLGLAGLVAAATLAATLVRREVSPTTRLLAVWVAAGFGLAYADGLVPFARRCVEGLHVAVVLLAALGLRTRLENLRARRGAVAVLVAWLAVAPTTLAHATAECHPGNPGLVPSDWPALFLNVRASVGDDGVYSDPRTSLYLAAFAGARTWLAHAQLTPGYDDKLDAQQAFFTADLAWEARAALVHDAGCAWLVTDISAVEAWGEGSVESGLVLRAAQTTWALYGPPAR